MSPIYSDDRFQEVMKPAEVLNIILNTDCTSEVVCRKKPVGVNDAAIFVVDTTKLRHPHDLKVDALGSWIHKGKPIRYFQVERSPSGIVYSTDPCTEGTKSPTVYKLTRIYYHHRDTPQFRKTIFYVDGMLLYLF